MQSKSKFSKFLYIAVLTSFLIPAIFLIVKIILIANNTSNDLRPLSDYTLMLVECLLGIIVIHIPSILEKKFSLEIPYTLYIMYLVFLYCAITLGEVRDFYYKIPHWDTILHTFSGVMLGFFGFMVIDILNRDKNTLINLSPIFVSLFAFCFAVSLGLVWEIYEYSFDGILGLNMQKFRLEDGTELVGRAALSDTMDDFIVDAIGALGAAIYGFIHLKVRQRKNLALQNNSHEEK